MSTQAPRRIAYVMAHFPRITETFVLHEILALRRAGIEVDICPLHLERARVVQPEVAEVMPAVHATALLSLRIVADNLLAFVRSPRRYVGALASAVGMTWKSPNFLAGTLAYFPKSVSLARWFEERGIEHVHAHFANHPTTAAFVIHRLTGIPFSFTAHGSDLHRDRTGLAAKTRAAAFAVMISEYNRELVVETCGDWARGKTSVVHCGIDPAVFAAPPSASKRPRTDSGPLRVACVASLREVKGHTHLIAAIRLLVQRGIACECHLIGDGPERAVLEAQIAATGTSEHFVLHGARPRPAVQELYAHAHVGVLTSIVDSAGRREGIPVSLMEAMASGLPVVATRQSGIPELVEHGVEGLLCEAGDASAIAAALERLARDPELRERMGRAGRAKVEREFDLERCTARLVELFGALRRGHGAPRAEERAA